MTLHRRVRSFGVGIGAWLLTFGLLVCSASAESNSETNATVSLTNQVVALATAQLEAMVQLQAQQESLLQELERSRREIAASLANLASNNLVHLNAMSARLNEQRALDLQSLRDSYRVVLAVLAAVTGFLLVCIIFLNFTSIRAVNRLTDTFQSAALVPMAAFPHASTRPLPPVRGEKPPPQLDSALKQLQRRIQAHEEVAHKSQPAGEMGANKTSPGAGGAA